MTHQQRVFVAPIVGIDPFRPYVIMLTFFSFLIHDGFSTGKAPGQIDESGRFSLRADLITMIYTTEEESQGG